MSLENVMFLVYVVKVWAAASTSDSSTIQANAPGPPTNCVCVCVFGGLKGGRGGIKHVNGNSIKNTNQ